MTRRLRELPSWTWLLVGALVILAIAARWMVPWATRDSAARLSTPVPPPLLSLTLIHLQPGEVACQHDVTLAPRTGVAHFAGSTLEGQRVAPALRASVTAPGYRSTTRVPSGALNLDLPMRAVDRELRGARICIRNAGHDVLRLNANGELPPTWPVRTTVDGKPAAAPAALELREARYTSRVSRVGDMLDRAMLFAWRPLGGGLARVWIVLVLILVPLATIGAVGWAMAADRDRPGNDDGYPETP